MVEGNENNQNDAKSLTSEHLQDYAEFAFEQEVEKAEQKLYQEQVRENVSSYLAARGQYGVTQELRTPDGRYEGAH